MQHIRVLIVEPHLLVGTIVREAVEKDPALVAVGRASEPSSALAAVERLDPDVVLVDANLPDAGAIGIVRALARSHPSVPVVVFGEVGDDYALEARRAGAAAFVDWMQIPVELTSLIRRVSPLASHGLPSQAARDLAVLQRLGEELTPARLQDSMERALAVLRQASGADASEIFLWDPLQQAMVLAAFEGEFRSAFFQITRFRPEQGYPGLVLAQHETILVDHLQDDPRYLRSEVKRRGFRAYLCVPLTGSSGVIGSLNLASRRPEFDLTDASQLLGHATPLVGAIIEAGIQLRNLRDGGIQGVSSARGGSATVSTSRMEERPDTSQEAGGNASDLVRRVSEPTFAIDREGRIAAWSRNAEELLGYPASEVLGKACWQIVAATTATGTAVCGESCAAVSCLQRGVPFFTSGILARSRSGRAIPVTLGTLLLRDDSSEGRPAALVFMRPLSISSPAGAASETLRIHVLGPLEVMRDATPVDWVWWKRKQAASLLRFLAHHRGRPVHREVIADALWPGVDSAQASERLKVTVYALRRELGGEHFVVRQGSAYGLEPARIWLDVTAFEDSLQRGLALAARNDLERSLKALEEARDLYRGAYLPEERYSDWADLERARLAERYLDLLRTLGSVRTRQGLHGDAAEIYRLAVAQDPGREDFHVLLIRALLAGGDRAQAAQYLHRNLTILQAEFEVSPSPDLKFLRQNLLGALPDPR